MWPANQCSCYTLLTSLSGLEASRAHGDIEEPAHGYQLISETTITLEYSRYIVKMLC